MARVLIDISPMAINRTAMFFVVRDSVRHLLCRFPLAELSACGISVDRSEFIANDFALASGVELAARKALGDLIDGAGTWPDRVRSRRDPGLTIVFDPLYLATAQWAQQVIVYVLDLTPITYPHWHDPRVSAIYARAFDLLYAPRVKIVAISESTRRDLWANCGIAPSSVSVIPLYDRFDVDAGSRHVVSDKKLLFVGSLEERKNVRGLVSAFDASGLVEKGYVLHIVGGDGTGHAETRRHIARVPGVYLLGALSDKDLQFEYETCAALVYPSFWEGFGLPVLEALARRIPCLLSNTGALPEVGGSAAVYVDPCSDESVVEGLRQIVAVDRTQPRSDAFEASCRQQLALFTRERYAKALDDVLDGELIRLQSTASTTAPAVADTSPVAHRKVALSRRERWKRSSIGTIMRLRIMEATNGPVPADSLSVDYLYGLQQEKRLNLARAITSLRVRSLRSWPRIFFSIVLRYGALLLTNAYVASHVNEITLLRLMAREESRSHE